MGDVDCSKCHSTVSLDAVRSSQITRLTTDGRRRAGSVLCPVFYVIVHTVLPVSEPHRAAVVFLDKVNRAKVTRPRKARIPILKTMAVLLNFRICLLCLPS